MRRRPPRDDDVERPHRRRRPGPAAGAAPGPAAADGRRDGGDGRLRGSGARANRRPGLRRDRHRHQDAGDGRAGALGRDPDAPARHAHSDNHRARRERTGGSRSPGRGLRLHSETHRPWLLRGGVIPRDLGARAESQGEGPAAGAGVLRRGTGADRPEAGARTARGVREGGIMSQGGVLIVDDDLALLEALPEALRLRMDGVTVETADSAAVALERIAARDYDAIVADIKMPGMDGLELLTEIRTRWPDTPTLMITGHGENELVVGALRGGACDFIHKPIDRDYLVTALQRAMATREASRRVKEQQLALEHHLDTLEVVVEQRAPGLRGRKEVSESPLSWLMGSSGPMEQVVQQIKQVADSPLTVLVEGETGTGKELVARAIHHLSARRDKPFVAVDCGAIPDTLIESELFGYEKGAFTGAHQRKEGQFQLAGGGTLFLDEVVNLPLPTQAKLLRALQERQVQPLGSKQPVPVDVRIIAASNVPLEREVRAGRFRQDVYYRLNEFGITLPPLRERDDILHLANELLQEAGAELGRPCRSISEAAAQVLLRYRWPGNVRELRNVIRRAILLASDVIEPEHLSVIPVDPASVIVLWGEPVDGNSSLKEIAETAAMEAEERAIPRVLQSTGGNKSEAARLLRTDYKTLHLKIKQYGISAAQFRKSRAASP